MIKRGQTFRNYKEVCEYLGEEIKTGSSKRAQLKRWGCLFAWHNEGHKYVIDDVFEGGTVEELRGGNQPSPHVDAFIPYVRSHIMGVDPDEYLGTQRLLGSALRLIPMGAYKQVNNRGMKKEDFYKKHGLQEIGSFEEYVSVAGSVMKDTVVRCLKRMQKNKEIKFCEAEVFIARDGRRRYMCLDGYSELVQKVEFDVCNKMAAELGARTKGRQLIHFIRGRKELMQEFFTRCMKELLKDPDLVKDLKRQYIIIGTGRELKLENVCEYYKVIHVIDYDEERIEKARGPDYNDKEQLRKIYEDVKPRIAARVTSSKKDVEKIEKLLFH